MCTCTPSSPSLVGARAGAAADGFEIDPERAVARLMADESDAITQAPLHAGDHPLRHRLRQRAEDQVDDALAGADAAVDRGGMHAVDSMVPSGAVTCSGRARPAFGRMVGSTTDFTA